MSVIIKDLEMPYGCGNCPFHYSMYNSKGWAEYFCNIDIPGIKGREVPKEVLSMYDGASKLFPEWCPLDEVPTPHGRLIDADALLSDIRQNSASYFADDFAHEWVDVATTVIPADKEEKR